MRRLAPLLLGVLLLAGCSQEPRTVECVCRCEGAEAASGDEGSAAGASAEGSSSASSRDDEGRDRADRAEGSEDDEGRRRERSSDDEEGGEEASGGDEQHPRVRGRPGSGDPVELPDEDLEEMTRVYRSFLRSAKTHEPSEMASWTTDRLAGSLSENWDRYEDRLYRSLNDSIEALGSGVELTEVLEMNAGNHEAVFRFGNGHEDRVVMIRDDGTWRLNRL